MEEKTQTKAFFYKKTNKIFRGFLCLLTFMAFVFGAICSAYAIEEFGDEILDHPKADYGEMNAYSDKMGYLLEHVLRNLDALAQIEEGVELIYPENESIYHIDYAGITELVNEGEQDSSESVLRKKIVSNQKQSLDASFDLTEYDDTKTFLSAYCDTETYIYITDREFRELFETVGIQNTYHRFSQEFSENAYFVFSTNSKWVRDTKEAIEQEVTLQEKLQEFYKEQDIKITFSTAQEEVTDGEETEEEDNVETSTEVIENVEIPSSSTDITVNRSDSGETVVELPVTYYGTGSQDYAVYDPDQNLYYSVWDAYFNPGVAYIYKASDLWTIMEGQEVDYSSMIFPMLAAHNYQNIVSWAQFVSMQFDDMETYREVLDSMEKKGVVYCLEKGDETKGNATVNEIKALDYYSYARKKTTEVTTLRVYAKGGTTDEEATDFDGEVFWNWQAMPKETALYVGLLPYEQVKAEDAYPLVVDLHVYPFFVRYIIPILAVTVILGILLLAQAIFLIRTTGRKYKGDPGISLNAFDCLPTEVWMMLILLIQACSTVFAIVELDSFWNISILSRLLASIGIGHLASASIVGFWIASLPFALCFMILSLSLARRVKAHNIVSKSLLVKGGKKLINYLKQPKEERTKKEQKNVKDEKSKNLLKNAFRWCKKMVVGALLWIKNLIHGMKGTKKLLCLFLIYAIFAILMMTIIFINHGRGGDVSYIAYLLFGFAQIGMVIYIINLVSDTEQLMDGVSEIVKGNLDYKMNPKGKTSVYVELTENMNHIGDGLKEAVETSLKDERMKTELITNVSHDLKTPLTSIINYINLLKTEKMPTPEAEHYIEVLDGKAQRLKQLTEDLVEAAKATSGNIELEMMPLTFDELMRQALGEFEDKFKEHNLTVIATYPETPARVLADGRRMFRIIENVLQNAYKYAMPGTRIYADLSKEEGKVIFTLKNVSASPLNISPEELMERFTRGDASRTTEGSGLGLSIAKDLTRLQDGTFDIILDGDLFKIILVFQELPKM